MVSQDNYIDASTFRGEINNEQLEFLKQKIRKINVDIPNIDPLVFEKFMINMNEMRGFHGIEMTLRLSRKVQNLHKQALELQ
jgi:CRISPR/Cas system-associated endoribonuclease Cas2